MRYWSQTCRPINIIRIPCTYCKYPEPLCRIYVSRQHIMQLMTIKTQRVCIYCVLTGVLFQMLPSMISLSEFFPPFLFLCLCLFHTIKATASCRALSSSRLMNLLFFPLHFQTILSVFKRPTPCICTNSCVCTCEWTVMGVYINWQSQ